MEDRQRRNNTYVTGVSERENKTGKQNTREPGGEGHGTHSSVLAWRIPETAEPGGLLSMGSQSRTRLKQLSSSSSSR